LVVGSFCTIVRLPGFDRSARDLLGSEEEAWLDSGSADRVFLIRAYAKSRKVDLTALERAEVRKLVAILRAEA
jgi:hypothetical protein